MVVRMRHNRGQRGNTRSHHRLEKPAITLDSKKIPHLRHRASLVTGEYRGRKVMDVTAKLDKRSKKNESKKKEGR